MGIRARCECACDGQGSTHPREIWKNAGCSLDITVLFVRPASPPPRFSCRWTRWPQFEQINSSRFARLGYFHAQHFFVWPDHVRISAQLGARQNNEKARDDLLEDLPSVYIRDCSIPFHAFSAWNTKGSTHGQDSQAVCSRGRRESVLSQNARVLPARCARSAVYCKGLGCFGAFCQLSGH